MVPDNKDASSSASGDAAEDGQDTPTEESSQAENTRADQPGTGDTETSPNGDEMYSEAPASNPNGETLSGAESEDTLAAGDESDTSSEGLESASEVSQLRTLLEASEAKASEHWDRLLRLQAEMENQRKRAQNDVTKARKFALESIVQDLLPVKDSLEMGLTAATAEDADPKSIVEGADLTLKMLAQVFEKNNIQEINPVDEKFDPEFHQAMSMQEVEGKASNTVTSVMQKGYTLNERLVRPALVMVAK